MQAAQSINYGLVVAARGVHKLFQLDPDWFMLVGPDNDDDLDWVFPAVLAAQPAWPADAWSCSWHDSGPLLLTHFFLSPSFIRP